MKKTILFKTMLLLCALIVGSGSVWAENVTLQYSGSSTTNMTVGKNEAATVGLNAEEWSVIGEKGSASNNVGLNKEGTIRLYYNASGSNTLTVSSLTGATITSITLNCKASPNDNATVSVGGNSISGSNGAYTINASSFVIGNGNTSNIQVHINSIVINYIPASTAALKSIKVEGTPATFCLGDAFNTTGMTVTAVLEDDTEKDVTDKADFAEPDMTTKGTKEVTVSYTENEVTEETSYNIYVNDFTGLSLSGTYKTEFWTNEVFSHDGVVVKAEFENDNEKGVDDAEFSSPDMSTAGTKTITVSYTIEGVTKSANYNITVTDKPLYTITWMVNGVKHSSRKVTMDELIGEFPTPSTIGGKTFAGWVTTATVAPDYSGSFVDTETATATGNITYYAVFAEAKPGTIVDVLNRALTGITGTQYDSWSGKKSNSNAVYAGQSAGGYDAIQLRSNNSNSGVVTTASGGNAKKVVVVWDSETTSGRTLDVYGKNSAYSAPTDLYNSSNQGTKLGSIKCGDGESTELTISGDYEYIGMRSNSGAMYLDEISITWDATTYTYTTTPAAVGTTVTVGETGYATFVYPYAVAIPANVKAYVVKEANSTSAKITAVENNIPANTPVVLKAPANDYTFNVADDNVDAINDNWLAVSTAETGNGVYVLYNGASGVGFYLWSGGLLGAGRVYLPAIVNAREFIGLDSETTGISTVNSEAKSLFNGEFFNMAGQRVAKPAKGLYIVNGKKVVIK